MVIQPLIDNTISDFTDLIDTINNQQELFAEVVGRRSVELINSLIGGQSTANQT